jgi:hypothetical protein
MNIKQAALIASKHSKCNEGHVRLFTISESSSYRQVRTRSITPNILALQRRRNGTETWRRRSCQCEHPFNYTWENFTERWRSATERKSDIVWIGTNIAKGCDSIRTTHIGWVRQNNLRALYSTYKKPDLFIRNTIYTPSFKYLVFPVGSAQ